MITPDLKSPTAGGVGTLLLIRPAIGYSRLGGSALAQVYSQIGADSPDLNIPQTDQFIKGFNTIQKLIQREFHLL